MLRVGQTVLRAETRPSQYSSQYSLISTFPILPAGVSHFQPCVRSSTVLLILAVSLTLARYFHQLTQLLLCSVLAGDLVSISRIMPCALLPFAVALPKELWPLRLS